MRFEYRCADGRKSLDRKIAQTVKWVNKQIENIPNNGLVSNREGNVMSEDEAAKWARDVIEQAARNLISNCFAQRVS